MRGCKPFVIKPAAERSKADNEHVDNDSNERRHKPYMDKAHKIF